MFAEKLNDSYREKYACMLKNTAVRVVLDGKKIDEKNINF